MVDLFSAPALFANFMRGLHKKAGDHSGWLVFSRHSQAHSAFLWQTQGSCCYPKWRWKERRRVAGKPKTKFSLRPLLKKEKTQNRTKKTSQEPICSGGKCSRRASAARNARILPIHPSVVSRYGRGKDAVKIPK